MNNINNADGFYMLNSDSEADLLEESMELLKAGVIDEDQVFSVSDVSEGDEVWLPDCVEE